MFVSTVLEMRTRLSYVRRHLVHRVGFGAAPSECGPVRQAVGAGARAGGRAALDGGGAADRRRAARGQDAAPGAGAPRAAAVPVRERAHLDAALRRARAPRPLGPSPRAAARRAPRAQRLRRRARHPRARLPRAARHRVRPMHTHNTSAFLFVPPVHLIT